MMSDEEPSSAFELGCSAFPSAREPERTGAPGAAVPGGHHYAAAGKCVAPRHCAAPYKYDHTCNCRAVQTLIRVHARAPTPRRQKGQRGQRPQGSALSQCPAGVSWLM